VADPALFDIGVWGNLPGAVALAGLVTDKVLTYLKKRDAAAKADTANTAAAATLDSRFQGIADRLKAVEVGHRDDLGPMQTTQTEHAGVLTALRRDLDDARTKLDRMDTAAGAYRETMSGKVGAILALMEKD